MAQVVYMLCALTSLGCTVLLVGRYRKTRVDLLFWSAVGFLGFAAANILLFIDLVLVPELDFSIARNVITLCGAITLVYGFIREGTR